MMKHPSWRVLLPAIALLVCAACSDQPVAPKPPPPDTDAPAIVFVSPADTVHDEDGDGLVDLRVEWTDAGAIDTASIRVRGIDARDPVDLLEAWDVERVDSAGALLHEPVERFLRTDLHRIEVQVADTAGNVAVDTVLFRLPRMSLYRRVQPDFLRVFSAVHCGDGYVYAKQGDKILKIDDRTLDAVDSVGTYGGGARGTLVCVSDGMLVAAMDIGFSVVDRTTMEELRYNLSTNYGAALSRTDPDVVYAGADNEVPLVTGWNWRTLAFVDTIFLDPQDRSDETVGHVAVTEDKLYATRFWASGAWAVDLATGETLGRVRLTWAGGDGDPNRIVTSPDGRWLYAAIRAGRPTGLARVDTQTDTADAWIEPGDVGYDFAMTSDGRLGFLTTWRANSANGSLNVLVDLPAMRTVMTFPRNDIGEGLREDHGVTFSADNRFLYLFYNSTTPTSHVSFIESYLVRDYGGGF